MELLPRQSLRDRKAKKIAVFTIVRNEPFFFPVWLEYYSRFFRPEDIYVLDHHTTDGSTDGGGFQRERVSRRTFDMRWVKKVVERKQRELLESYDTVVFVDCDEIIAPNPRLGDLGEYLARFNGTWVNCLGYEVLQMPDEMQLVRGESLLSQRSNWFPHASYDKPAVSTIPIDWKLGFHGRRDNHCRFDPDLRLIHLHRVDYQVCLDRHRAWRRRRWNRRNLSKGWAAHNRIVDEDEFRHWYFKDAASPLIDLQLEQIPAIWRGVV